MIKKVWLFIVLLFIAIVLLGNACSSTNVRESAEKYRQRYTGEVEGYLVEVVERKSPHGACTQREVRLDFVGGIKVNAGDRPDHVYGLDRGCDGIYEIMRFRDPTDRRKADLWKVAELMDHYADMVKNRKS